LKLIGADCREIAQKRLEDLGLKVVFAPNTTDENFDRVCSTDPQKRAADLMTAFADPTVKAVLTVIGGYNSNTLLKLLDYDLIARNPKIFMGFSDITALHCALNARAGLVTYYGPHYSSLGMELGCEYTLQNAVRALFETGEREIVPSESWSDDLWFLDQKNRQMIAGEGHWQIHSGSASGHIVGGNLCTFLLQLGTPYQPHFEKDTVLFLEDDGESSAVHFDRNLQALINQDDFKNVTGLVIGRFQKASKITRSDLEFIVNSKPELARLPIIGNIDMGHTTPINVIPLGGTARLENGRIFVSD
jgi:muramoyltetrapeptide carboxypeptidase LdcA involved in peptidoglycan recycling